MRRCARALIWIICVCGMVESAQLRRFGQAHGVWAVSRFREASKVGRLHSAERYHQHVPVGGFVSVDRFDRGYSVHDAGVVDQRGVKGVG